jgi:hypothetical protein
MKLIACRHADQPFEPHPMNLYPYSSGSGFFNLNGAPKCVHLLYVLPANLSKGGIKTINREVGWQAHVVNDLFASFSLHFPHLFFTISASGPLA